MFSHWHCDIIRAILSGKNGLVTWGNISGASDITFIISDHDCHLIHSTYLYITQIFESLFTCVMNDSLQMMVEALRLVSRMLLSNLTVSR